MIRVVNLAWRDQDKGPQREMNAVPDSFAQAPNTGSMALAPGQTVGGGRFLLKRVLGQGGMGVVWLAQDKLLRELVALKFLPPQVAFDPAALDGLRKETLRSRKLSHPNILRIHDLVDAANEPVFISMEYVDGPNLHVLRANRPGKVLTWSFLAPLVRQLCAALDYAHGEKVIHRDLKPANLMVESTGRLKLADFGLARVITDSMSRSSGATLTSGTLAYMSPQQADGKTPRVTDDLYSLGATLYESLTSTPPFHSGDVAYQVRNTSPEPMSTRLAELGLMNDIPEHVSALVASCLAKYPEERPQSAREILDCLDAAQAGIPTREIRQFGSTNVRLRKTPWALVALLAACGIGLSAWYAVKRSEPKAAQAKRPPVASAASSVPGEEGFVSLFNGKDLSGWDYDPKFWSVEGGSIKAATSEEGVTRKENTCLIWKGNVVDFDLRLSFRLADVIAAKPANSGVMYRSRRIRNWQVRGYQCDLQRPYTGTLILLEDANDPRSPWGHSVFIKSTNGPAAIKSAGVLTPADKFKQTVKTNDWNELVIVAKGNRITHKINGVVTLDAIDETLSARRDGAPPGVLALELKRATILEFKNIHLKRL